MKKAKELGATVLMDVTDVAISGWMSVIHDPTGAIPGRGSRRLPPQLS